MQDERIIRLFWERDPSAIPAVMGKYGNYCQTVAWNILGSREDAAECVNDTWLRVWNSIPPQRPVALRSYLAKITRNLAIHRYHAENAQKRGGGQLPLLLDELSECIGGCDPAREHEAKELAESIRTFTASLPQRDCDIFLRRFFFGDTPSQIAARYAMTENHVRVNLSRSRKKLRQHLIREGYIYER